MPGTSTSSTGTPGAPGAPGTSGQLQPPSVQQPPPTTPAGNTVPVPPNGGTTSTPLSSDEASVSTGLSQPARATFVFAADGKHLGADFMTLGSAISAGQDTGPFMTQTVTDMRQLLSAWVDAGPASSIPGQFLVDVVNAGIKAISIGNADLDRAYGGALTQFFTVEQSVVVEHPI